MRRHTGPWHPRPLVPTRAQVRFGVPVTGRGHRSNGYCYFYYYSYYVYWLPSGWDCVRAPVATCALSAWPGQRSARAS